MATNYLPTREADLLIWSNNFQSTIVSAASDFGLDDTQADAYRTTQNAFVSTYQIANDSATRTPLSIELKNTAKKSLITMTRQLVKVVQGWPGITDAKRVELEITVPDVDPTPVPIPESPLRLEVESVEGHTLKLELSDSTTTTSRAKPDGGIGANLFSYVGEEAPADIAAWKFEGGTSQTKVNVEVPSTVAPGTKVFLTAFWFNRRAQSGPACTPVSTGVGYEGVTKKAA